jgi:hypothetical protein
MRVLNSLHALGATAAIALIAGCSGAAFSTVAPPPTHPQGSSHQSARHCATYFACPATGAIEYVSDYVNSVIDVYAGKFASQAPCGQITSGLNHPAGMFVKTATHDLYVANTNASNVLVYHRGQTAPYNVYADPGVQYPLDVVVIKGDVVVASNRTNVAQTEAGSLSTWIGGSHGGSFVGNYAMTNDTGGAFITARRTGTLFYDDFDSTTGGGAVWRVSCPAGICGVETQVGATNGVVAGLAFTEDDDLLANDLLNTSADTFELPNPSPSTFPIAGGPFGMAIDLKARHWFTTDVVHNNAAEYSYPGGTLVGTVFGNISGSATGIAVDP